MKTKIQSQPRGFTLIELLVVVVIIAILAGAAIPVIGRVMEKARATEARAMMSDIQVALTQYYSEYNRLPSASSDTDETFDTINDTDIVATLLGENVAVGTITNSNPKRMVFIEPKYARNVGAAGESAFAGGLVEDTGDPQIVDPWGNAYRIALDTNYDNLIDNPLPAPDNNPAKLRGRALVWSLGVPGRDTVLTSWE